MHWSTIALYVARGADFAAARKAEYGTDTFMATGRLAHDGHVRPTPRGRIPKDANLRERMARKLRTKPGRATYARGKAIVEPVFGQIMTFQDDRGLLLPVRAGGAVGFLDVRSGDHRPSGVARHSDHVLEDRVTSEQFEEVLRVRPGP
jgi:hypothetical protein